MAGKTVVVLGGGVGGLVASNALRKKLGKEHRIVLVDKMTHHVFAPSFTWVMLGWRDPNRISREPGLLTKKGIEYVNAEALEIDTANMFVKTGAGDFAYDYLIVALGAELNPRAVPGLPEAAHTPCSLEGDSPERRAFRLGFRRDDLRLPDSVHHGGDLHDGHHAAFGGGHDPLSPVAGRSFPQQVGGRCIGGPR